MGSPLEVLASGYQLAEAPRADESGRLWFSDALGGGVYRWSGGSEGDDAAGTVETVLAKRRGVGGMVVHTDGGVVVSGRNIVHLAPDGTQRVLLEPPEGVTGFNDICATPTGGIVAGGLRFQPFSGEAPVPGGFWRLEVGDAEAREVVTGIVWPNGCGYDDDTLYACDYQTGTVHVLDTTGQRPFATSPSGAVDGLAVDVEGGVWIALGDAGGIGRFTADGRLDRVVDGLAPFVTSLAFSTDGSTLYVTSATTTEPGMVGRMASPVRGRPHARTSL